MHARHLDSHLFAADVGAPVNRRYEPPRHKPRGWGEELSRRQHNASLSHSLRLTDSDDATAY